MEKQIRAGNVRLVSLWGMTEGPPATTAVRSSRLLAYPSPGGSDDGDGLGQALEADPVGITIYGCGLDEAALFREMAPRFGVCPTIVDATFSDQNLVFTPGNQCVSISHKTPISESTLLAFRQAGVKYISTRSVGCNHIDVQRAEHMGMLVETVTYSPDSVADFTVMLMLMTLRNAKSLVIRAQDHDFRLNEACGRELRDLTVGVIGTGRIGEAVLRRLEAFGCRVLAHDRWPQSSLHHVDLDDLLRECDIVTLHTPLSADTYHLLDRQRIGQMQRGALVINTGRGSLVDTAALIGALESGQIGGAALDVIEGEEGVFYSDHGRTPIENNLLVRLLELPNVLITPHTAYFTDHSLIDIVENTLINCLRFEGRAG